MKIYVINLDDRADRRESVTRQLDPLGVDYQFFKAISVADNPDQYFAGKSHWLTLMESRRTAIPSEVACYASHLLLWKKCAALNEPIVILEDDFSVTENFRTGLQFVAEHVDEYGFIRLEPIEDRWSLNAWEEPEVALSGDSFRLLFQVTVSLRATGYALSPAVAKRFIAMSSKYMVPLDHFFRRQWVHRLPLFAMDPPAIDLSELSSVSSIMGRDKSVFRHFIKQFRPVYRQWAKYSSGRTIKEMRRKYAGLFRG